MKKMEILTVFVALTFAASAVFITQEDLILRNGGHTSSGPENLADTERPSKLVREVSSPTSVR
ncbi:MAG: hypothetical protein ABEJ72_11255, partial [Candidatus Aenigmatarchaeota archaeon]